MSKTLTKSGGFMKNTTILGVVALLVVAFLLGHFTWTNEVEVPGKETIVYQNVTVTKEVPSIAAYLGQAKNDFWLEVTDNEQLHFCGGHEYDISDIVVSKTYTNYAVTHEDEDTYTVSFEAKLRYAENGQKSCFDNYEVSVLYDEGENPEVEVD